MLVQTGEGGGAIISVFRMHFEFYKDRLSLVVFMCRQISYISHFIGLYSLLQQKHSEKLDWKRTVLQ